MSYPNVLKLEKTNVNKTKNRTKFKFGTLIILPANIIHICSAPPECFAACSCQYSKESTSCFIINRWIKSVGIEFSIHTSNRK